MTFITYSLSLSLSLDVNVAFSQAMAKMGFESDILLHNFRFTLPAVKSSKKQPLTAHQQDQIERAWNLLGLSYTPKWPLHVLFTPAVLDK